MMKIGDRVKLLSEIGVGIVKAIVGNIATVEIDGFDRPVMISDLVQVSEQEDAQAKNKINPSGTNGNNRNIVRSGDLKKDSNHYGRISFEDDFEDEPIDIVLLKRQVSNGSVVSSNEPQQAIIIEEPPFNQIDYTVKLLFVPVSNSTPSEDSDLDMFLVNDSSYHISYVVGRVEKQGYVTTLNSGSLDDDTKIKVTTFKRSSLATIFKLHISVMPFKKINYTPQPFIDIEFEMHPLKFMRASNYVSNDYFDEPAYQVTLIDNCTDNI